MPEQVIAQFYASLPRLVSDARAGFGRPMTYAEKVLSAHLFCQNTPVDQALQPGEFSAFRPDRVVLQDATGQMALLQFMSAGLARTAIPATVHCDHFVRAHVNAASDLETAKSINSEVYGFLRSAADKYGLGFWEPGSGIIHQVVLENYAFPGGLLIGADSHTPNAGGMGMIGVGVGGLDTVDAMAGLEWELRVPSLIGVKLTGQLNCWASAKDIILHLAGKLGVKGATNAIIEYFGPGVASLTATGRATVCNMGAELGATASLFAYDEQTAAYLNATGRGDVAQLADLIADDLRADSAVEEHPEDFFTQLIEVDLDELEPYVNGPFTPDAATPISQLAAKARDAGWPLQIEAALIGSCTNSSYQDLARASAVAKQALEAGLSLKCPLYLNPGSARTEATAQRDELLEPLQKLGAVMLANACGPCIGQWQREIDDPKRPNTIVTSFNRNFSRRADGNPNTHSFVASPEMVVALALAGRLDVNPLDQTLDGLALDGSAQDQDSFGVKLDPPGAASLPVDGFTAPGDGYRAPTFSASIDIDPDSKRLAVLEPFPAWDGAPIAHARLLIKVQGKCTTDHISPAGPWLAYRGHLARISDNLLLTATNAFTGQPGVRVDGLDGRDGPTVSVAEAAHAYQDAGLPSVIVAEENYGEGSSREHAAMEPRFLGVAMVLAKSFARIHETNLKKQGMLALTFADPADYDLIQEGDRFSLPDLPQITLGHPLVVVIEHVDGSSQVIAANHSYTATQIGWLRAGSALAALKAAASTKPGVQVASDQAVDDAQTDSPQPRAESGQVRVVQALDAPVDSQAIGVRVVPCIAGDGIGPEITPVMRAVVDAAVAKSYGGWRRIDWLDVMAGRQAFEQTGSWLPDATLEACAEHPVSIKGPLETPVGGGLRSLNVALRRHLDLYACVRPVRWFEGVTSPLRDPGAVDMVVFRENTEDVYAGIEWEAGSEQAVRFNRFLADVMGVNQVRFPETSAFGVKPISQQGTVRLMRAACQYAIDHNRNHVTIVHKGNIMKYTEGGFRKWAYEVAQAEFPGLQVDDVIADAFLQNSLLTPRRYSVIATPNLNGDYISDQLAAMVGGIGIAPGGNINYETGHAVFEATHGTAPSLVGTGAANPSSLLLSGAMMLEFFGWTAAAQCVTDAMAECFRVGLATQDIVPDGVDALTTEQFCDEILARIVA